MDGLFWFDLMTVLAACPELFPAQPPWGWKEASNEDGWGLWGLQTGPNFISSGAVELA